MSLRTDKVRGELIKYIASFIETESNRQSLITVTDCTVSNDLKKATVFITVFPTDKEGDVIDFLKRKRGDMRNYLKSNFSMKVIPFLDVALDLGEKNRQHMDELFRQAKEK